MCVWCVCGVIQRCDASQREAESTARLWAASARACLPKSSDCRISLVTSYVTQ